MATSEPIQVESKERRTSPILDYQLINVNITSSSPPETDKHQSTALINTTAIPVKLAITRANSAKHQTSNHVSSAQTGYSAKSSAITFQEPIATAIKRPNSTIGIPGSIIPDSQSLYNSLSDKSCHLVYDDYVGIHHNSNVNLNPMTAIETPESDIDCVDFNPIVREKSYSLSLPDARLPFLCKGSSNPFLTAEDDVSPGQYSLPNKRASIVLNGNILHSISSIAPGRPPAPRASSSQHLSIYVQDNPSLNGSDNLVPMDSRFMGSTIMPRGSTASIMTNSARRPSFLEDEECYNLRKHYVATTGRKDTVISVGKNLQIQVKTPTLKSLSWKSRTCFEKFLLILLLGFLMTSMFHYYVPNIKQQHKVCTSMECVKTAASLLNAMDLTADPCDDFFQFACGTWVKKHVIPEDKPSTSTFEVMADEMQIILKDILEQPPNSADNSATMKAKRFYQSCMNIQQIEVVGVEPIYRALSVVGGWPVMDPNWSATQLEQTRIAAGFTLTTDKPNVKRYMDFNLENLLGKIRGDFNQPIIVEQYVGPDDRNSSHNIIQFDQTSFGLPSREYFLKEEPNREKDAYLELMVDIAELMGAKRDYAIEEMSKVLEFETELANASMPEADRHDTSAIYNKMTIRKLKELVPEFDWMAYLKSFMPIEVGLDEEVVVYSLEYYTKMGKLLTRVIQNDKKVVINYAVWRLMKSFLPFLDGEFGVKRAKFRKVLSGISADQNRWRQCVELVNKKMGMAVGALFIKDNFDPASKESALEMIHNIREAFNELLHYNDWMDDETRRVATEKANAINERIGYSESLTNSIELSKEYNNLEIVENQFLENVLNVYRFESLKNLMKLGTTTDKNTWTTDPAVVNAFYSPNRNDIVFPAGVLQPLFYSHHFPKSLNYGGIGVVIGHEITHGFDDRGRQFDKDGNMKQWWNIKTIKRFRSRAQCIVDQYSSYVLEDINANINGRMTQGENIADNGGLKQAYRAFKKWERQYGVEPLLPGLNLTHDQLFFLNYAQIWCGSMRPEDALNKVRSSVHSPGPIRVLGPLSNSYDFSNAYNCPVGSRMNPVKKCSVW